MKQIIDRYCKGSEAVFGEYSEDKKWQSLTFNKPVDPQMLVDAINKIDKAS